MTNEKIELLHVDDSQQLVDAAAELLELEDESIEVVTATSADEGLEVLSENESRRGGGGTTGSGTDIDCVVSDYQMPDSDGLEFLEDVREEYPDLPFILFTGKGSEEIASEAISAGVTDYLQKTGGSDQYTVLANRVQNAVEQRRARTNYREIFEKASDAIFIHDPETGVVEDL
ncbi:MAG: response regulator, partial [Halobacteria archaeon]|nr:response regulator [Halobacteria archaeon]